MARLVVELDAETHKRLKMRALELGTDMSTLVRETLTGMLGSIFYEVEESHMEGDVRVVDKAKLTGATLKGKPIVKEVHITGTARGQTDAVATKTQAPSTAKRPLPDFSKSAQVKGKMGR